MPVVWYGTALRDLTAIREYIGRENAPAAKAMSARIFSRSRELGRFPSMGRPGRLTGTRELMVNGTSYIIAYEVVDGAVGIIRVIHGAQDWPDIS